MEASKTSQVQPRIEANKRVSNTEARNAIAVDTLLAAQARKVIRDAAILAWIVQLYPSLKVDVCRSGHSCRKSMKPTILAVRLA
jgi:hypothetical protein